MKAAMVKCLRHFQPDKSAADDDRVTRLPFVQEGGDAVHVRDVAQGENMRQIRAGNGRHDCLRTLAQDKLVVRHVALPAIRFPDTNGFRGAIDRKHLVVDVRANARAFPEFFRCHDDQFGAVVNFAGDEIRQAAVGEGDVGAALEDLDVGIFINPARFGGGGSAPRHAPDDDNAERIFHKSNFTFCFTTRTAAFGAIPRHFRQQQRHAAQARHARQTADRSR